MKAQEEENEEDNRGAVVKKERMHKERRNVKMKMKGYEGKDKDGKQEWKDTNRMKGIVVKKAAYWPHVAFSCMHYSFCLTGSTSSNQTTEGSILVRSGHHGTLAYSERPASVFPTR